MDPFSPAFTLCSQSKLKKIILDYSEEIYTRSQQHVANTLQTRGEQHVANSPTDILMDFDRAALNSVRQVYTNTEFKGCFYHFSSNRWKHTEPLSGR